MSTWTPPGQPLWTSDGYINGFIKQPGAHANYRAGRIVLDGIVVHYTVGRDSTGIGMRGVFAILLPKDGPGKQFNPFDAVTFHACEWNRRMVGAETEKMGDWEPTTPDQIKSWATIAAAFAEKRVAMRYDGSTNRVPVGGALRAPYTAHRTLQHRACDQHSDYLPDADMAAAFAMAGGGAGPAPRRPTKEFLIVETIASEVLEDGKVLLVGHGTDQAAYAALISPAGDTLEAWTPLGGRIYDSPSTITRDGRTVYITASGDSGGLQPPPISEKHAFNVPFVNCYTHSPAPTTPTATFLSRFTGWKKVGGAASRIKPQVAPGI